jgi:hypothetical protein
MATLNANSNPVNIALQAFLGVADESHETAIDFESSNITGAALAKYVAVIPATSSISVNLATVFANCLSPQFLVVFDNTPSPGQNFGVSINGVPYANVAAASWWGYCCDGTTLPANLYLNNLNSSASTIVIAVITN